MESAGLNNAIQDAKQLLADLTEKLNLPTEDILQSKAFLRTALDALNDKMSKIINFTPHEANYEDPLWKQLNKTYLKKGLQKPNEEELAQLTQNIQAEKDKEKLVQLYGERCQLYLGQKRYFPAVQDLTELMRKMENPRPEFELLKGHIQLLELGLYNDAEKTLEENQSESAQYNLAKALINDPILKDWPYENYLSQLLRECAQKNGYQFVINEERDTVEDLKCRIKPLTKEVIQERMKKLIKTRILCKPQLPKMNGEGFHEPDFVILKKNKKTKNWDFLILDCNHYQLDSRSFDIELMADYAEEVVLLLNSIDEKAGECLNKAFIVTNRVAFHQYKSKKEKLEEAESKIQVFGIPRNSSCWEDKIELFEKLIAEDFKPSEETIKLGDFIHAQKGGL